MENQDLNIHCYVKEFTKTQCACGCGTEINTRDRCNRRKRYVKGHNARSTRQRDNAPRYDFFRQINKINNVNELKLLIIDYDNECNKLENENRLLNNENKLLKEKYNQLLEEIQDHKELKNNPFIKYL
ncbi:MAG TPA: hypothetical protein VFX18_00215 [Candidatus Nitrosocosmicus sp.]|nr:hypothetical protein [Candidatus Nitrosocosmicus sp.]